MNRLLWRLVINMLSPSYDMFNDDFNYLCHYGLPGMKWYTHKNGKWQNQAQYARGTSNEQEKFNMKLEKKKRRMDKIKVKAAGKIAGVLVGHAVAQTAYRALHFTLGSSIILGVLFGGVGKAAARYATSSKIKKDIVQQQKRIENDINTNAQLSSQDINANADMFDNLLAEV